MLLEELLREERAEGEAKGGLAQGKIESILFLLDDFGPVPDELRKNILEEKDMDILLKYLKLAAHTDSLADFIDGMSKI